MQLQYINNLRAIACILVILSHSAMPATDTSFGMYMVLFSLMSSPSSELFVTISSSLLAPTKQDMFSFYKKRFTKLIPPFLFWSIVVSIIAFFEAGLDSDVLIKKLLLFPIVPVTGVYWFVYVISGLYLMIPLISPWLEKATQKELLFLIGIWFLTLLLPYVNIISGDPIYKVTGDYYFILSYLGGFIGYLFLGVYLRKYPIQHSSKIKSSLWIALLVFLGTLPVIYGYAKNREGLVALTDNLSLTSALYVAAFFCFFQNFELPKVITSIFNTIAKYSYGIYLVHIIVIRDVLKNLLENYRMPHPLIETPFIAFISVIVCLIVVKVITFFPKSKYIVGV